MSVLILTSWSAIHVYYVQYFGNNVGQHLQKNIHIETVNCTLLNQ